MTDTQTNESRLKALARLQQIDSQLDRLRQVRGGLPEEVRDLEDELEGLNTRITRLQEEIESSQSEISRRTVTIHENRDMIKKYDAQLMNVKNSREFEALNKEIELANLEILTAERKIKQFEEFIAEKEERVAEVKAVYDDRARDLDEKQKELNQIIAETEKEEKKLQKQSDTAAKELEPRLLASYQKIRQNMRNGLAVVAMDRGACGGCFAIIPPQRQYEVRQKKKLMVCENCGRILVDVGYFGGEKQPVAELEAKS
jgi:predicted  nucleic acid-binding Zn-ribbon protein